jgi:hypothetical protein
MLDNRFFFAKQRKQICDTVPPTKTFPNPSFMEAKHSKTAANIANIVAAICAIT